MDVKPLRATPVTAGISIADNLIIGNFGRVNVTDLRHYQFFLVTLQSEIKPDSYFVTISYGKTALLFSLYC